MASDFTMIVEPHGDEPKIQVQGLFDHQPRVRAEFEKLHHYRDESENAVQIQVTIPLPFESATVHVVVERGEG